MNLSFGLIIFSLFSCTGTPLIALEANPSTAAKTEAPAKDAVLAAAVLPSPTPAVSGNADPASTSAVEPAAVPAQRPATSSTVVVETPMPSLDATSTHITAKMIDTAAGAYEDPARYFQLLPGVSAGSDARNDFLVRGGNPSENLFVVDNVDVHSISHLALSNTTGGFVSMIDNAAVESMTLHTAGHDAKFDDRLSSVVEISTIPDQAPGSRRATRHMTEAGIAGVGGMDSRPLGQRGSLFVSGREGVLRFFTNDIGMNGVPDYSNSLVRGDTTFENGDKIWGIALTGRDSMNIHPSSTDLDETNPFDVRYSGWRNTTGINWQHGFSPRSFGVFTLSNSEQAQTIVENAQDATRTEFYNEQTHNGDTSIKTQFTMQAYARVTLSGGATETLSRLQYNIVQPDAVGMNPYDPDGNAASATDIHRNFATSETGAYGQATITLPRNLRLTLAARAHHWAFGDNFALTPKVSLAVPLGGVRSVSFGYAEYAQTPASLYMLSFPQNTGLRPIRARHLTAAMVLVDRSKLRLTVAGYHKTYGDYPVSTQFPQLSLANVADTFGQAFLMFPMASQGLGKAAGAELSLDLRPTSRLTVMANVSYSRNRYSGLDGVLRNGSNDLPLIANVAAVSQLGHGVIASVRYAAMSGRPYTPDDLALSTRQNRDVYDLAQVNAMRAPAYGKLDFRLERSSKFRSGVVQWHVGLDNALNQKNFYSFQWQPNKGKATQQNQMPIFPDGGVKYIF